MTVYVDDARIPATVRNGSRSHTSAWCHLTADTREELHEFAARLGRLSEALPPAGPATRCPGCGTAALTAGRETCQACGAVAAVHERKRWAEAGS